MRLKQNRKTNRRKRGQISRNMKTSRYEKDK